MNRDELQMMNLTRLSVARLIRNQEGEEELPKGLFVRFEMQTWQKTNLKPKREVPTIAVFCIGKQPTEWQLGMVAQAICETTGERVYRNDPIRALRKRRGKAWEVGQNIFWGNHG